MAERDAKGRFQKGTSGNPGGRPVGEFSITALIDTAVTREDWLFIIDALLRKAKRGDLKAIEMLMDRRFGKPQQPLTGDKANPLQVQIIEVVKDTGGAE